MVKAFCSPVWYVRVRSTWRNCCHTFLWQLVLVNWTCSGPHWDGWMVWPGIIMIQTEYRLVSVGVSAGPACFPSKTCNAWINDQKLMASVHLNMDYMVSVLGGPLSVMQVSWAASKFKATSYYSVHPVILSATHMLINLHANDGRNPGKLTVQKSGKLTSWGWVCVSHYFQGF